ncbi:glycosyltransferase [Erwinia sp. S59]|uniref:glycosyltransferase n=1 Tax=Erwinia sp. S59 TaxID=2769340 RepID=UPI001909D709|nr:glycosyltransferase [Erwinia sp. S59]MBK0092096.1 glycosyltransferase [Erwinia sp. S59]
MNVTALIVTFNRLDKLKETLMATRRLPFQHIVIVNNASNDGTKEWLETIDDSRISLLHKNNNNGGAGGFRFGSEYISKSFHTDWVIFYDDDAYPCEDFLTRFENISPNKNEIYCALVRNTNGEVCKMNLPWKSKTSSVIDNIKYLRDSQTYIANPRASSEVISFSFVGAVIPAKILSETYSFIKEELFIYYDDVYYSSYLNLIGHKINFRIELEFIHDVIASTNWDNQEWKIYYLSRNLLLSKSLYHNVEYFSLSAKVFRIIKYALVGLTCKNKKRYYNYLIKGIFHGIKKVSGNNH